MKCEVNIPDGRYCALKCDEHYPLYIGDHCPCLHRCDCNPGAKPAYYCWITNHDMHLSEDAIGILKWSKPPYVCPSLSNHMAVLKEEGLPGEILVKDTTAHETISRLRAHVLERLTTADMNRADERAVVLRPFDEILEDPAFCRLPCTSRDSVNNMCRRKMQGLPCEWHQGYD